MVRMRTATSYPAPPQVPWSRFFAALSDSLCLFRDLLATTSLPLPFTTFSLFHSALWSS